MQAGRKYGSFRCRKRTGYCIVYSHVYDFGLYCVEDQLSGSINALLPVLEHLMGPALAKVYDVLIMFYLFSMTMVMIAGGGVTLQMYKLPFWIGIFLLCIVTVGLFFWDIKGILSLNSILIPILVAGLLYALVFFRQPIITRGR